MKKLIPYELIILLAIIWGVFVLDFVVFFFDFNSLGIRPRQIFGLIGVPLSAFLHGGIMHIVLNSFALMICGMILKISYSRDQMVMIIVLGILMSGLLTWVISSSGIVVGASGLVYCFIGLLLANIYFNPSLLSWTQALLCLFFYSGALIAMFRVQHGISWAGHFSGLVAGIVLSLMMSKKRVK
ncbi:rhomboid family intramembrane serine protease [Marinicellulosiphila megalodicopiae]|uniref:rhomboid family intramembrane serine protease n=1 Tax=Marinicellulosiphila megalodicopiae TaxID=2724896 RepID=UPI003BB1B6CB